MSNLDLVAPAVAIVALFGVIGLVVQSIRQGRAIRQVEERLREGGAAAGEVSLDRIRQLQTRAELSSGAQRGAGPAITIAALLGVAVLAGGAWFWLTRGGSDDSGGGTTQEQTAGQTTTTDDGTSTNSDSDSGGDSTTPDEGGETPDGGTSDEIPADVPPLLNKAEAVVAIFNASGVSGAAGEKTRGLLEQEGYSIGEIDNSPDGRTDLPQSVVMWTEGKQEIAWNVARDLGLTSAPPLDGLTPEQIGAADVAIIVGLDLANRP